MLCYFVVTASLFSFYAALMLKGAFYYGWTQCYYSFIKLLFAFLHLIVLYLLAMALFLFHVVNILSVQS